MTKREAAAPAVEIPVALRRTARGQKRMAPRKADERQPKPVEIGNVPRIARLMALAIRFEGLIKDGVVRDYADLARLGGVTRARVTQIMNLLRLAPEIQEELLLLPRSLDGKDRITEKGLREVAREPRWAAQREAWERIVKSRRDETQRP